MPSPTFYKDVRKVYKSQSNDLSSAALYQGDIKSVPQSHVEIDQFQRVWDTHFRHLKITPNTRTNKIFSLPEGHWPGAKDATSVLSMLYHVIKELREEREEIYYSRRQLWGTE